MRTDDRRDVMCGDDVQTYMERQISECPKRPLRGHWLVCMVLVRQGLNGLVRLIYLCDGGSINSLLVYKLLLISKSNTPIM